MSGLPKIGVKAAMLRFELLHFQTINEIAKTSLLSKLFHKAIDSNQYLTKNNSAVSNHFELIIINQYLTK